MKILTQDRAQVLDTANKDFYVNSVGGVIAKKEEEIELGNYKEDSRAKEVLKEIFKYMRCKKPCYAMPEE